MQHPVQDSPSHLFVIKDIDPAGKLDISVDNERVAFIAFRDHLKQQLGTSSVEGCFWQVQWGPPSAVIKGTTMGLINAHIMSLSSFSGSL